MLPNTDSSLLSDGDRKEVKKRCIIVYSEHMRVFHPVLGYKLWFLLYLYSKTNSSWRGRTIFSSIVSNQSYPAEGRKLASFWSTHSSTCNAETKTTLICGTLLFCWAILWWPQDSWGLFLQPDTFSQMFAPFHHFPVIEQVNNEVTIG